MGRSTRWREIWERRSVTPEQVDHTMVSLADLIAADGFDTGFGDITAEAWTDFVARTCATFDLVAGDSLFEVGCGAGAFLYLPYLAGISVGGADYSAALVDTASRAMPDGTFLVQDANAIDVGEQVDVILAFSVFHYFDGLDYARSVLGRMCAKARRGVAILDVPDAASADDALAYRHELTGGAEKYAERYAGLEHQSYDRDWMREALEGFGMVDVRIESQSIEDYRNGQYRFNAYGSQPGAVTAGRMNGSARN